MYTRFQKELELRRLVIDISNRRRQQNDLPAKFPDSSRGDYGKAHMGTRVDFPVTWIVFE